MIRVPGRASSRAFMRTPPRLFANFAHSAQPGVNQSQFVTHSELIDAISKANEDVAAILTAEFQKAREESNAEFKKMREESKAEFKKVREESKAEFKKAREESNAEFKKMREESNAEFKKVRVEMKA